MTSPYLLDIHLVSELRKPKPRGAVVAWFQTVDDASPCPSAVTFGEIQAGIELTREQDFAKAAEIEAWLKLVAGAYNVLAMDAGAATPIMCARNARSGNAMRLNLKVPFAEKDEAKKLGARWDAGRKLWYIEGKDDLAPFARWSPSPHDAAAGKAPARKTSRTAAADRDEPAAFAVGRHYVEQPRVCDCLPWDVCDKCRATALPALY